MRARVFPGCNMAAFTVYKHRVMGVAVLHPENTHALIGKFYLAELHFGNGYMEIGLLISSLHALLGSRLCRISNAAVLVSRMEQTGQEA